MANADRVAMNWSLRIIYECGLALTSPLAPVVLLQGALHRVLSVAQRNSGK